jgi:mono/diheme cytochrome c family protein
MKRSPWVLMALVVTGCATNAPAGPGMRPAEALAPANDEEPAVGKRIYDFHCARCHGPDGKDDSYPFIVTLDGIGDRYTLDRILEETWATGFVSPHQFTPEEQRALAKYVARF